MTHDELLAKIADIENIETYKSYRQFVASIRTVVELHKPEKIIIKGFKTEHWCVADNNEPTPYPCPTIQAIEKELNG